MRLHKTLRPGDENSARFRALRLLERRPHAAGELKRKLLQRGYEPVIVRAVIEKLTGIGLLNDEKFAGNFVRYRLSGAPRGPRRLAAELISRGVDRTLAESTSRAAMGEAGEAGQALLAARKYLKLRPLKYAGKRTPEAAKERQKVIAWLARQGFGISECIKALRVAGLPADEEFD